VARAGRRRTRRSGIRFKGRLCHGLKATPPELSEGDDSNGTFVNAAKVLGEPDHGSLIPIFATVVNRAGLPCTRCGRSGVEPSPGSLKSPPRSGRAAPTLSVERIRTIGRSERREHMLMNGAPSAPTRSPRTSSCSTSTESCSSSRLGPRPSFRPGALPSSFR
jgi:hypothetical protein